VLELELPLGLFLAHVLDLFLVRGHLALELLQLLLSQPIGFLKLADFRRRRAALRDRLRYGVIDFLQTNQQNEILINATHHHPSMGMPHANAAVGPPGFEPGTDRL
jgi:hypothetical protein